jgi:hypothetical protein
LTDPREAYKAQRANARRRGIAWDLTFDQWLAWWGADLVRRGVGPDRLQMQRIGDAGPYALGNIRKGYPRDNMRTYSIVCANRRAGALKADAERARDVLPVVSDEPEDEMTENERWIYENVGAGATPGRFLGVRR